MADVAEMILVWGRRAIYGRKIAARIDGKTDRLTDNRIVAKTGKPIGGKIAGRTRAVKPGGSIELIRWPVNMADRGEIMPK